MFSTFTNILFFLFDLSGFCTEYSRSSFRRRFSVIIFGFQQCFVIISTAFTIYQYIVDDFVSNQVYLANEAMKSYTAILAHWLIVTESFASRASQHKYWILIKNIQKLQNNPRIELLAFSLCYIQGVCGTLLAEVFFTSMYFNLELVFLLNIYSFMIQNSVYRNRIHYYSMHIEIIISHLECVIRNLDTATKCRCIDSNRCYSNCQCIDDEMRNDKILNAFQSNYLLIAESIEYMNRIFGWSNAATILFAFNILLSTINWSIYIVPDLSLLVATSRSFSFN